MEAPLVSIIVPVYNTEKYLFKCLDSIARQSYKNIEVIVVDDGSTDASGSICDDYAGTDRRFRVIHQSNKWLSGARNTGLENVNGAYVCFIDSDDYIDPEYVSDLYDGILAGADISMIGFDLVDEEGTILPVNTDDGIESGFLTRETCLRQLVSGIGVGDFMFGVVWNKMYPTSLIRSIRFQPYFSLEDAPFNFHAFSKADKVYLNSNRRYAYVQRKGSIMSIMNADKKSSRMAYNRFNALKDMLGSIDGETLFLKEILLRKVFSTHALEYRASTIGTEYESLMRRSFQEGWASFGRQYIFFRSIPIKERILIALAWKSNYFWHLYKKRKHV